MLPFVTDAGDSAGQVFLCYATEDSARIDELEAALRAAGLPVWRASAQLLPGQDLKFEIRRAISTRALVFLACFSTAAQARPVRFQNEELTIAVEQARLRPADSSWLIPVRLDDCAIPDMRIGGGRMLADLYRADLFGDGRRAATGRLVTAIRRVLFPGEDSGAAAPPQPDARDRPGPATCKDRWVDAFLAFGDSDEPRFRRDVLRRMADELGLNGSFPVADHALARDHVIEIVRTCWAWSDRRTALRALVEALTYYRPYDQAAARLPLLLDECG